MTIAPIFPDRAVHRRAVVVAEGGRTACHAPPERAKAWGSTELGGLSEAEGKKLHAAVYLLGRHADAFKALLTTLTRQTIDPEDPRDMPAALADGVLAAMGSCHAPAVLQLLTAAAATLPSEPSSRMYNTELRAARALDWARDRANRPDIPKPDYVAHMQAKDTPPTE